MPARRERASACDSGKNRELEREQGGEEYDDGDWYQSARDVGKSRERGFFTKVGGGEGRRNVRSVIKRLESNLAQRVGFEFEENVFGRNYAGKSCNDFDGCVVSLRWE